MPEDLLSAEASIRLFAFGGSLLLLIAAEALWPRRAVMREGRWFSNLSLAVLNTLLLRFAFPLLAVGWAIQIETRHWGFLQSLALPVFVQILLAVVLLDCVIYWQHRLFHRLPWLWRLHRMHHSDVDFDVTTGLRFHPGEMLISMLIKFVAITALGTPALAVLIFEIILSSSSLFEHSNLRLPKWLDRRLRWLLVTPDMHRIHHSVHQTEHDSNYGFNFSFWDRLFGSYTAQPRDGQLGMRIGLQRFRDPSDQRLHRLLLQPITRSRASTTPHSDV
jgi:sterol desaturase/sphingolipid hydroxylase (fatty acid hydroxylase superfamily)